MPLTTYSAGAVCAGSWLDARSGASNGYVCALLTSRTGDFTAGIAALGG